MLSPTSPADIVALQAELRKVRVELEQSRLQERDGLIYYRAEVERSRVFENGLRVQKQQASAAFDRFKLLHRDRDDSEKTLRAQLQRAQQVINQQGIELSTYREMEASASHQSPLEQGEVTVAVGAGLQYPVQCTSPESFAQQPGASHGGGLERLSAPYDPAPMPGVTEYPTSAMRDLPRPDVAGEDAAGSQSGNPSKKRRRH
jgi:electron transfer flavoprotein alpha subunit